MKTFKKKINGGLYLVVDPKPGINNVLPKIKAAIKGGVNIIQLWNNWKQIAAPIEYITEICNLAHEYNVPVIINENWQWLTILPLDGIHFDQIPKNWNDIREKINRPFIAGLTCGNDQTNIDWSIENKLDYISFCSMYPSSTANSCELIKPETIRNTRMMTNMVIFVAGGITRETIPQLYSLGINGVAVVSAIMKAEDPELAAREFNTLISEQIKVIL
jgi:thiamine-phosphate pyrophosphorylase